MSAINISQNVGLDPDLLLLEADPNRGPRYETDDQVLYHEDTYYDGGAEKSHHESGKNCPKNWSFRGYLGV